MSLGRVLLVDDDKDYGTGLRAQLRRVGFDCDLAASASAARQALETATAEYDFALIDLHLTTDPDLCDGAELYDELERDYPGMEMELFTAQPEATQIGGRRTFEWTKGDLAAGKTHELEAEILKGVNKGLRLRLEWKKKVMDGLSVRFGLLNEKGRVLWEAGTDQTGWIRDLLTREAGAENPSRFYRAVTDRTLFHDQVAYDGKWLTCELAALPQAVAGSHRLLTIRDTTRTKHAASLAQEFLQYDKFEKITPRICAGLIELGFRRARLWLLQGDDCTLALCQERGHGLSEADLMRCAFNYRQHPQFRELFHPADKVRDEDAVPVTNPAEFLPPFISKILNISNTHQTLAIPLFVRSEPIGLLTVDKVGSGGEPGDISLDDSLIGRLIGRVAAAALDRGIHEWQYQRVQSILSQVQAGYPDDQTDAIYRLVLDKIIGSLGNDKTAPWLPRFKGAEIAVRAHRFDRENEFTRIYTTPEEDGVFPPTVDITEGLVGDVMGRVRARPEKDRFGPWVFPSIFANKPFQKQYREMHARLGKDHAYVRYLSRYLTKTMIPLLDLDGEVLGFFCFHAPRRRRSGRGTATEGRGITNLHRRWLEVLGQLCSRILEIRERHNLSVSINDELNRQVGSNEAMAKFGERSANISHEMKHFFQRLVGHAALLRADIRKGQPLPQQLARLQQIDREVMAGTQRLATLNDLFKKLSRDGTGRVSVREAVERSQAFVAKFIQEAGAACVIELPPDLPALPMTLDQALLIFTNLIRNATESIREHGQTAGRVEIRAEWSAPHLTVTVADNGGGIRKENRARLFQIGFTTKRGARGMGVGLTLVRRMVNDHQGSITLDPAPPGQGATFRLVFTLPPAAPKGTE